MYKTLGNAKCKELYSKADSLWVMLGISTTRKSSQVGGIVREGIVKDFIREFLPAGFGVKSGLIFDNQTKTMSPQIDAIIYKGVPLLEYTDAAVVEKEQVRAIVEIKSWLSTDVIFGQKAGSSRNPNTGLAIRFAERKAFLPAEAKYILFTFDLHSGATNAEVIGRLDQICDFYGVVRRKQPRSKGKEDKEDWTINFEHSISRLLKWLRNL
jgi:hypothetical protein